MKDQVVSLLQDIARKVESILGKSTILGHMNEWEEGKQIHIGGDDNAEANQFLAALRSLNLSGSVKLDANNRTNLVTAQTLDPATGQMRDARWGQIKREYRYGHNEDDLIQARYTTTSIPQSRELVSPNAKGVIEGVNHPAREVEENPQGLNQEQINKLHAENFGGGGVGKGVSEADGQETTSAQENEENRERRREQLWRSEIAAIMFLSRNMAQFGKDAQKVSGVIQGGIQGARAGSAFGPIGTAIGATVGTLSDLVPAITEAMTSSFRDAIGSGEILKNLTSGRGTVTQIAQNANMDMAVVGNLVGAAKRTGLEETEMVSNFSRLKGYITNPKHADKLNAFLAAGANVSLGMDESDLVNELRRKAKEYANTDHSSPGFDKFTYDNFVAALGGEKVLNALAYSDNVSERDASLGEQYVGQEKKRVQDKASEGGIAQYAINRQKELAGIFNAVNLLSARGASAEEFDALARQYEGALGGGSTYEDVKRDQKFSPVRILSGKSSAESAIRAIVSAQMKYYGGKGDQMDSVERSIMGTWMVGNAKDYQSQMKLLSDAGALYREGEGGEENYRRLIEGNASEDEIGAYFEGAFRSQSAVADIIPGLTVNQQNILKQDFYKKFMSASRALIDAKMKSGKGTQASPEEVIAFMSHMMTGEGVQSDSFEHEGFLNRTANDFLSGSGSAIFYGGDVFSSESQKSVSETNDAAQSGASAESVSPRAGGNWGGEYNTTNNTTDNSSTVDNKNIKVDKVEIRVDGGANPYETGKNVAAGFISGLPRDIISASKGGGTATV